MALVIQLHTQIVIKKRALMMRVKIMMRIMPMKMRISSDK
jgi:hypothetical protein